MTRRPVLPGADELFRRTDTPAAAQTDGASVTELPDLAATTGSPALRAPVGAVAAPRRTASVPSAEESMPGLSLLPGGASSGLRLAPEAPPAAPVQVLAPQGPRTRGKAARPADGGRSKHDEKITVYLSGEELLDLESARLTLRGVHGVAADRGRIVREAIAIVLADLVEAGEDSVLVCRLRGR